MKVKNKKLLKIFAIVPIILMILIFVVASYIFERNSIQSYEYMKSYKESEVNRLVTEVDAFLDYTNTSQLTEEQRYVIRFAIDEIDKEKGVYCYLLDTDYKLLAQYSDTMSDDDIRVLHELKQRKDLPDIIGKDTDGDETNNHFTVTIGNEHFDFYWHRIPTKNTEYYILLGTSDILVTPTRAIQICKIFIAVLNIVLTISIYGNICLISSREDKKK